MTLSLEEQKMTEEILAFAEKLTSEEGENSAEAIARRRDWIDPDGRPTDNGRDLLRALRDQEGTRGAFRLLP